MESISQEVSAEMDSAEEQIEGTDRSPGNAENDAYDARRDMEEEI